MSTSSSGPAITVRGIGKRYRMGGGRNASTIMDLVGRAIGGGGENPYAATTFWALRDISFDVPPGHVLGLLGRNGAGKTTLVRILARITSPTEGSAVVNGRVGALFQMGTGFHPDLSGRENISLSGAVLGMSDDEVAEAFDAIVDFADIGEFLDAPVKHYSSGMYSRLAFSVSAHLRSEIMLLDEGLSVGDLQFQEKCRVLIRSMVRDGRTVVYVSHQLASMRELCDSGIVLEQGEMRYSGPIDEAIAFYQDLSSSVTGSPAPEAMPVGAR